MNFQETETAEDALLVVGAGDDLDRVPGSHAHLVSPQIRDVFIDPVLWMRQMAVRCPFPKMVEWLSALADEGMWELHLFSRKAEFEYEKDFDASGFCWNSEHVYPGLIELPRTVDLRRFPKELQKYYSLVDDVNGPGFDIAGPFLNGATKLRTIRDQIEDRAGAERAETLFRQKPDLSRYYAVDPQVFDIDSTYVWGYGSTAEAQFVFTLANLCGWRPKTDTEIYQQMTITEGIDWWFGELVAGRCPEFDFRLRPPKFPPFEYPAKDGGEN